MALIDMANGFVGFEAQEDVNAKREKSAYNLQQLKVRDAQENRSRENGLTAQEQQLAITNMKVDEMKAAQEQAIKTSFRNGTYEAIHYWKTTGSTNRINLLIKDSKNNPYLAQMFPNVARFDSVTEYDASDPQLEAYMKKVTTGNGKDELDKLDGKLDGVFDKELIARKFTKQTNVDGSIEYIDMDLLTELNGYKQWYDPSGSKADAEAKVTAAKVKVETDAEAAKVKAENDANKPTKQENTAKVATRASKELDELDFFNMTQEQINSPEIQEKISLIEANFKFRDVDRKTMQELAPIAYSSEAAVGITKDETGIIDNVVNKIAATFIDEGPKGVAARSAINGLLNVIRHDLFGSAQTDNEIQLFMDAYSHLGQGIVPVLSGLSSALGQVLAKVKAVQRQNNPYIVKAYMGISGEKLDKAMDVLQRKIKFYTEYAKEAAKFEGTTTENAINSILNAVGQGNVLEPGSDEQKKALAVRLQKKYGLDAAGKVETKSPKGEVDVNKSPKGEGEPTVENILGI